ncbi:unnamed protein product, partial [Allacma fusca]
VPVFINEPILARRGDDPFRDIDEPIDPIPVLTGVCGGDGGLDWAN